MPRHRIAYVVPTKDRRADLRKLLVSLAAQTAMPAQIIVVDGGDDVVKDLLDDYPQLPLTYVREYPPSLARQRNAGMAALSSDITVAGYLDDDLELASDATAQMAAFWDAADDAVGGAAFTIVNQPLRHPTMGKLADFFLINGSQQGQVLSSGFATSISPRPANLKTDWLYGGATLWRRDVIATHYYDEWYIGHGYLEDLDFSYRVSRSCELWVVASARVWHWPHPIRAERNVSLGRQQIVNRVYFVRKLGCFTPWRVVWGLIGQLIRNGLESVKERNRAGVLRAWGNVLGVRDLLVHGTRSIDGIWK